MVIRPARTIIYLALALVFTGSGFSSPTSAKSASPPFKITAIKAMLFYEQKATFSKDVLADPKFVLWNTIIGDGDAGGGSASTLVLVEVTGKAGSYQPDRKIEFVASYKPNGKSLRLITLRRAIEIGILSATGKFYVPFWLYDTGCNQVKLSARIVGQAQPSAMKRSIDFECGE